MIPIKLKEVWIQYNSFPLWKKLLLILPFVVAIILGFVVFFLQPKDPDDKLDDAIKHNKDNVDQQIEKNLKRDKDLETEKEVAKNIYNDIQSEIKDNEEIAEKIINEINDAVTNNDADRIKRIHKGLVNRAKARN